MDLLYCLDRKKAKNTLPGNSNLFEWTWPGEGSMEGYILGREVPNIGEWTKFSPAQITNLQKKNIELPKPTVSAHTVPKNQWIIAMPNTSGNKIFILLPSPSSAFTLSSYSLFYYIHHHPPLPYYPIPYLYLITVLFSI